MREHPKPPLKRVPNVTVFFFLSFATLFGSVGINDREILFPVRTELVYHGKGEM